MVMAKELVSLEKIQRYQKLATDIVAATLALARDKETSKKVVAGGEELDKVHERAKELLITELDLAAGESVCMDRDILKKFIAGVLKKCVGILEDV